MLVLAAFWLDREEQYSSQGNNVGIGGDVIHYLLRLKVMLNSKRKTRLENRLAFIQRRINL